MAEILAVKSLWWVGGVVGWVPVHRLVTATVRFGCDNFNIDTMDRPYIEHHLDVDQLGGLPGCSVEHYLIQMLNFVHKSLDEKEPIVVLLGLVDFS